MKKKSVKVMFHSLAVINWLLKIVLLIYSLCWTAAEIEIITIEYRVNTMNYSKFLAWSILEIVRSMQVSKRKYLVTVTFQDYSSLAIHACLLSLTLSESNWAGKAWPAILFNTSQWVRHAELWTFQVWQLFWEWISFCHFPQAYESAPCGQ